MRYFRRQFSIIERSGTMTELRWTPAAVTAALAGDLENFLAAASPGGIEAQEARGQQDLVNSSKLPVNLKGGSREQFEAIGIRFGEMVDDLFAMVELPVGWKVVPTDHSMNNHLVDDRGRKRAHIFYKAAFYDRRAHMNIVLFYCVSTQPVGGRSDDWDADQLRQWEATVEGGEKVVFTTSPQGGLEDFSQHLAMKRALENECYDWLEEHAPDWRDPLAYWD